MSWARRRKSVTWSSDATRSSCLLKLGARLSSRNALAMNTQEATVANMTAHGLATSYAIAPQDALRTSVDPLAASRHRLRARGMDIG